MATKNATLAFILALGFAIMSFVNPPAVTYKVDTKKSTLGWIGRKVTGEHSGNINLSSGNLSFDGKTLKGGTFEIDMNSLTCTDLTDKDYNQKLVGHLKSEDFFSTSKYPKATFVISEVKPKGNDQYDVAGKLTIKGITHEVNFPATIKSDGNTITANAKIVVDRTKYDIKYGSGSFFSDLGDKAIDNNFDINLNLVASK